MGFLGTIPENPDLEMLEAVRRESERFALKGDVFYFYAPEGFHKTKMGGKLEKALGVGKTGTGRTLGTLMKVMEIVRAKELCSQGLKNREIADTLGIPLATVKRYLAE